MNLIQIQERLKGMPIAMVMEYANGMNPEVPPYVALGELNRRKNMEQRMQPAQLPQGTVKEKIEEEVGLAALQKQMMDQLQTQGLRQQQASMSQGQEMAKMPGPAPQGVPQPEVPEELEMADGGVATLMVPDDQFEFGSGGIIAFKDGGLNPEFITDAFDGMEIEPSERQKRRAAIDEAERLRREEIRDREERQKRAEQRAAQAEFLERADVPVDMLKAVREGRVLSTNPITPDTGFPDNRGIAQRYPGRIPQQPSGPVITQLPNATKTPQGIAAVAPQVQQPQTPMQTPQGPMQQALQAALTGPQQPIQDYDAMLKEAQKRNPYLNKQPGLELEKYIEKLEQRDREAQSKFEAMEKERARAALWKALIASGEASRGQRGIGALMGGFGRSAAEDLEASFTREERQQALMREREMNVVKLKQEIENARIAAAKGDFKQEIDAKKEIADLRQRIQQNQNQLLSNAAQIEAQNARNFEDLQARAAEGRLNRETQILVANIQAASGNRLSAAERIFERYQQLLKQDPTGKLAEQYMVGMQRAQGVDTRYEDSRTRKMREQIKPKEDELGKLVSSLGPLAKNDPRVIQLRKEIDDLTKHLGGQTSQAPLGSRENPIPIR